MGMHQADYLKIYNLYCSNHPCALMKLESLRGRQIRAFLDVRALAHADAACGRPPRRPVASSPTEASRHVIGPCSRSQEVRMRPESRSLDLGSFLIKPVQRICKYPLLVKVRACEACGALPDSRAFVFVLTAPVCSAPLPLPPFSTNGCVGGTGCRKLKNTRRRRTLIFQTSKRRCKRSTWW